jgi:V-type H+-transporting ATPase subunit B
MYEVRSIFKSLDMAWKLLRIFPPDKLKKINEEIINKYYARKKDDEDDDVNVKKDIKDSHLK